MFALFAGNHYYPFGGMNDFIGRFNTIEDARKAYVSEHKDYRKGFDWGHIVDLSTMQIVEDF